MNKLNNTNDINADKLLLKKIIRIAQFESEIELGVNPSDFEQANTGNLTEQDFEYIRKICGLVEKKLSDSTWLKNKINEIENKETKKIIYSRGIRFDDELFKVGRGILESFIIEKYKEQK
mgnify:CR=1 FL=1